MKDIMLTKDIMNWLLAALRDPGLGFAQVEPYEGQFEDSSDFLILPPSVFVALDRATNNRSLGLDLDVSASLYLCTAHIHLADPGGMLDRLDALIAALHNQAVNLNDRYSGRLFYAGFEWLGIFPGFSCYKLSFDLKG